MMRWIVVVVGFIFFAPVYSQNPRKLIKNAEDLVESKNYRKAEPILDRTIELDPEMAEAYLLRALVYEKNGKPDKASQDYVKASSLNPKDETISFKAAKLFYKQKNYRKAIEYAEKAIHQKNKYPRAYALMRDAYIKTGDLEKAEKASLALIELEETASNLHQHGLILRDLKRLKEAKKYFIRSVDEDKFRVETYIAFADVLRVLGEIQQALNQINNALSIENNNQEALVLRSRIFFERSDYARAINDVSLALSRQRNQTDLYFLRGTFYQKFTQYQNAISDYSKVLSEEPDDAEALYRRAVCYEQIARHAEAADDYQAFIELKGNNTENDERFQIASDRVFELLREEEKPKIKLQSPSVFWSTYVEVPENRTLLEIEGLVEDESSIKWLKINNKDVEFKKTEKGFEFTKLITVRNQDIFNISTADVYDNVQIQTFNIKRTEVNNPELSIMAPYVTGQNELALNDGEQQLFIEGKVFDESLIDSIFIDGVSASYRPEDLDPSFSAVVPVLNKSDITITVADKFGNRTVRTYELNRSQKEQYASNPMGRTWVVFIDNSDYDYFTPLNGATRDIALMKSALADYQIDNIIHKNNMTKRELEKFFSIELRDLVRRNKVNSLLIWYSGHGKVLNNTGYWVPADAKMDEEFTFFNINALKASMQGYSNHVIHTLIVSDACETGPAFLEVMRSDLKIRSCDDSYATSFRSAQVLSSAGMEEAADDSRFATIFSKALSNESDYCVPIEKIVRKIYASFRESNQQKPEFGKISGLDDENGTFFFIKK